MTTQKSYYRVMLDKHADECYRGKFFGVRNDDFWDDLSKKGLHELEDQDAFIEKFGDAFQKRFPNKNKTIACKTVWTICKGIKKGDIVICPKKKREYWVGEVISDYSFQPDSCLPQQRKVAWLPTIIARDAMSSELKNSTNRRRTCADITEHAEEIERLISGELPSQRTATDESIEDAPEFALEKHLEDFLVKNWASTELGKKYDIIGQQYPTYTGFIDILAISKDEKEYLVIELKKGLASDRVVGQILKYIGDIQEDSAESWQKVRGAIIAFEDDKHLNRARSAAGNIDFYEYKVNFSLSKK